MWLIRFRCRVMLIVVISEIINLQESIKHIALRMHFLFSPKPLSNYPLTVCVYINNCNRSILIHVFLHPSISFDIAASCLRDRCLLT